MSLRSGVTIRMTGHQTGRCERMDLVNVLSSELSASVGGVMKVRDHRGWLPRLNYSLYEKRSRFKPAWINICSASCRFEAKALLNVGMDRY